MPSRLRFLVSQLGPKPKGAETMRRLVEASDLPGAGWKTVDQRTWRTGRQSPNEPWAQRAAAAGSVTAWRSFRSQDRWLWVQLVPLAHAEDAQAALAAIPSAQLRNLRAGMRLESETVVPGLVVEGADAVWACEQRTSGHPAAGVSLMLAWTSGADLVVAAASGAPEWTWDELTALATCQLRRLSA